MGLQHIERLLPFIAQWGVWSLGAAMLAVVVSIVWLGRGSRALVPARWPARIASLLLVLAGLVCALGEFALLGPMRPMLAQVRSLNGISNQPAGELDFRAVADDAPHRLSELRGQVVVLNLWATWCGPCLHELPAMDRIAHEYGSRGLAVVTFSTEDRTRLRAFADRHPVSTLNVYAAHAGWLDVRGRPLTLVIDRGGVVREVLIGARTYEELAQTLERWIRSPA
jgi:cytochrome c biogenesis protein CcmG/thiol:disulfide interchange protein DsbE